MNFSEILTGILKNNSIVGAISSSVLIILFGFYLRRKGVFKDGTAKILTDVILSASLPALAFNAFMQDINKTSLMQGINLLIWGFAIYIILIFITKLIYIKYNGDKKVVLEILTTFGSTTFFGIPIISAVYGATGVMYASIFNIAYRVFLYSYAYIKMSGIKADKNNIKQMFLNSIVLATFLGMFIWVFQDSLPQITIGEKSYAFLRIDKTAFWLFKPMTYLAALSSPLAWLAIGAKLADISLVEAISSRDSWIYSFIKVLVVPFINLIALYILTVTNILPISFVGLASVIIMMATPTATVAAAYAIKFDKESVLTSNCSLLSTIFSVICMPLWIVVLEIIKSLNIYM
ncbi:MULTISPECIES: AEC family transporter [Fusobacterium]|jgi:predicted permease|uniref:Malate permease n=1 Tax=Fusobacterium mortiferum ATCC 9817 TaxID=469616 RepID=A0ABM6TUE1_FUSMR|nr:MULTISPECIES: AEC family transporter [Fusobacterium]AVQ17740.1 malate permease [Fusobacterium mortiferum ATCC 9817]EEO36575.2 transporter, auxin efflux carrier (AEC) family protein [Fusobacterium mortiferum ATCC 9817]MCF2698890.1 AEC family transporter [Fusobacterium mortiferum]MSS61828.1 AEC family transporter [Fusobacterium sp. FSA-380-WT-2B]RHF65524.1 AEC family transporter [Fusobacterium mortiferum]